MSTSPDPDWKRISFPLPDDDAVIFSAYDESDELNAPENSEQFDGDELDQAESEDELEPIDEGPSREEELELELENVKSNLEMMYP